jgi:hypothetical protein
MDNIKGGFYLVSNVLDVKASLPAVISPTITLTKANDSQVDAIHSLLAGMSTSFTNPRGYGAVRNSVFEPVALISH